MHPLVDGFIKGRAKFKKLTGKYYDREKNPRAACDYGAMYWGVYGMPKLENGIYDGAGNLADDFPELKRIVPLPCDDLPDKEGEIRSIIIHINDSHDGRSGWTDEKKVQWLEKVLGPRQVPAQLGE